jgi:hypothetical protein
MGVTLQVGEQWQGTPSELPGAKVSSSGISPRIPLRQPHPQVLWEERRGLCESGSTCWHHPLLPPLHPLPSGLLTHTPTQA